MKPEFVLDPATGNLTIKTAGGILVATLSPTDQLALVHAVLSMWVGPATVQPVPVLTPVRNPTGDDVAPK